MPRREPKVHIYWRVKEGETKGAYVGKLTLSIPKNDERAIIAQCWFWVESGQIYIAEITVAENYRKLRYGTMIINILKGYAEIMKYPLVLYSSKNAVPFYKKLGFSSVKGNRDKRIITKFLLTEPDDTDMFLLPRSMKNRKRIRLIL